MPTDRQLADRISRWLEAEAPTQLPDRVLRATFERTRKTSKQAPWHAVLRRLQMNRMIFGLGSAAVVLLAAVLALGLYFNGSGVGAPPSPSSSPTPSAAATVSATVEPTATPSPTASPRPAPDGEVLHVSERHGYSILLPDDSWIVEERAGTWILGQFFEANTPAGVDYFEDRSEVGEATLYVYLSSQPIPDGMSFEEWVATHDASTDREQPCFYLVGEYAERVVDSEPARSGTYTCDNWEGTGNPHTGVQTMVAHSGRGYAIYVWPVPDAPGFPPASEISQAELEAEAARWLSRFSFTD